MQAGIVYCDRCGRLVPPGELERSALQLSDTATLCRACAQTLSAEGRAALTAKQKAPTPRRPTPSPSHPARAPTPPTGARAEPPKPRSTAVLIAAVAVGLVAGIGVSILALAPGDAPAQPQSGAPPVVSFGVPQLPPVVLPAAAAPSPEPGPATGSVPADPAAFVQAEAFLDSFAGRYDAIRAELRTIADASAQTDSARRAAKLLELVDAKYAAAAEAALATAREASQALAARGEFDAAAGALESVRARFPDGEWLSNGGAERIDSGIAAVREQAAAAPPQPAAPAVAPPPAPPAPQTAAATDGAAAGGALEPRDISVILAADFERDAGSFANGQRVTDPTYGGSAGAFRTVIAAGADGGFPVVQKGRGGLLHLKDDTRVTCALRVRGSATIWIQFWNGTKRQNYYVTIRPPQGAWTLVQENLMRASGRVRPTDYPSAGDEVSNIVFVSETGTGEVEIVVDDFVVHTGDLGTGSELSRRLALARDMTPDLVRDGYYLDITVYAHLRKACGAGRATARKLMAVGGGLCAGRPYQAALVRALAPATYAFAPVSSVAGGGVKLASIRTNLAGRLARETPECVVLVLEPVELSRGIAPDALRPAVVAMVEAASAAGAIPILHTLPLRQPDTAAARELIEGFNAAVLATARESAVPCLDVYATLNGDPARHFTATGGLTPEGIEQVAARFARLYRILERHVLARVDEPEREGAAAAAGGTNLLANGGFEERRDETHFAAGWTPHQGGAAGARQSVRLDRTLAHGGEYAVVLHALEAGAQPGLAGQCALAPGSYVLRFYASADVGQTAQVAASVAGIEAPARTVREDWTLVEHSFTIAEKEPAASVRIRAQTVGVRVWIDDVALVRVR